MRTLVGEHIYLRALEPEDLSFIYQIENDEELWELSATQTPYSRYLIKEYLEHAHLDIYEAKQLRLLIETHDGEALGLIDLFDFDPKNKRVGVGILIAANQNRGQGYGKEALSLLCNYCFAHLGVHQVYANIGAHNVQSQRLFEKLDFNCIGLKKDWNYINGNYQGEYLYQRIHHVH